MDKIEQQITERYALYNGDCIEVMSGLPDDSVHLTLYSPPFAGLYIYSSDKQDMSNSIDYDEFFAHYRFCAEQISRVTLPGRMIAVHCMDIRSGNTGNDHLMDFPGDLIRLHESCGMRYVARYHVWKEPLTIRNRTMMKSLSHKCLVNDSTKCSIANADYLLIFRNAGENLTPVEHPVGLTSYAGTRSPPNDILHCRGMKGNQIKNKYSQWVWRQYASAFWDDVRLDRTLPHKNGKDPEDERHVHPLQLDVIERAVTMWSNPGEVILTPFMGVGSEVFGALINDRRAIGIELKSSYYRQAIVNVNEVQSQCAQESLF